MVACFSKQNYQKLHPSFLARTEIVTYVCIIVTKDMKMTIFRPTVRGVRKKSR